MSEGTTSRQGTEDITYPTNPVDVHTPPPSAPPPPTPTLAYIGGLAAALAVGAYLLGQPVAGVWLMVAGEAFLIANLAAMPYTGPIINPPPPPPPTRPVRPLIAVAAVLFGLAVLGFGFQSRLGFLGAGVAGIAAVLGGLLLPGGQAAPSATAAR